MNTNRGDMPAMPLGDSCVHMSNSNREAAGMTIREQMAMAAMQGLLAEHSGNKPPETLAEMATKYADALLTELECTK